MLNFLFGNFPTGKDNVYQLEMIAELRCDVGIEGPLFASLYVCGVPMDGR